MEICDVSSDSRSVNYNFITKKKDKQGKYFFEKFNSTDPTEENSFFHHGPTDTPFENGVLKHSPAKKNIDCDFSEDNVSLTTMKRGHNLRGRKRKRNLTAEEISVEKSSPIKHATSCYIPLIDVSSIISDEQGSYSPPIKRKRTHYVEEISDETNHIKNEFSMGISINDNTNKNFSPHNKRKHVLFSQDITVKLFEKSKVPCSFTPSKKEPGAGILKNTMYQSLGCYQLLSESDSDVSDASSKSSASDLDYFPYKSDKQLMKSKVGPLSKRRSKRISNSPRLNMECRDFNGCRSSPAQKTSVSMNKQSKNEEKDLLYNSAVSEYLCVCAKWFKCGPELYQHFYVCPKLQPVVVIENLKL